MSFVLLQTIFIPVIAALLVLILRSKKGIHAGWISIGALAYTTMLLCMACITVFKKGQVFEGAYSIGS